MNFPTSTDDRSRKVFRFRQVLETCRHAYCSCALDDVMAIYDEVIADVRAERDVVEMKLRLDLATLTERRREADEQYLACYAELGRVQVERDALREELAKWKIYENCGEPLAGPGIYDKAVSENEKGLEQMWEDTMARAEKAERELAEARAEIARLRGDKDFSGFFASVPPAETKEPPDGYDCATPGDDILTHAKDCQWRMWKETK